MPDMHSVQMRETLYQGNPEHRVCVNCCQKFGAQLRDRLSQHVATRKKLRTGAHFYCEYRMTRARRICVARKTRAT
jgi:hypothetical protein